MEYSRQVKMLRTSSTTTDRRHQPTPVGICLGVVGVYRPISEKSLIGLVMALVLRPAASLAATWAPVGEDRRHLTTHEIVQRAWGPHPDMDLRHKLRSLYYSTLMVAAGTCGLTGFLAFAWGGGIVHTFGLALVATAACCLALALPGAYRGGMTASDWQLWVRSGRPSGWQPSSASQPRSVDLGISALLAAGFIWGLIQLAVQS